MRFSIVVFSLFLFLTACNSSKKAIDSDVSSTSNSNNVNEVDSDKSPSKSNKVDKEKLKQAKKSTITFSESGKVQPVGKKSKK